MDIKNIKRWIVRFTPPVLTDWHRRRSIRNRKFGFMRRYATWQEARAHSTGYDSDIIIEKVKEAALEVRMGRKSYERDGIALEKTRHSWHLLASLLWIASLNDDSLNLVDFGGALGTSYFQNRKFLSHLRTFSWNIVEQEKFVRYGKELFEDTSLHFFENNELGGLLAGGKSDAVLLSSSLQYIEYPYSILEKIISSNPKHIIFDKTPFLSGKRDDIIVVQKVSPSIYDASYPCWIFSLEKFLDFFERKGYRLVEQINHDQRDWFSIDGNVAEWNGYLFEKTT